MNTRAFMQEQTHVDKLRELLFTNKDGLLRITIIIDEHLSKLLFRNLNKFDSAPNRRRNGNIHTP